MDDRTKKLEADVAYWKKRALAQAKRLDVMPKKSFVAMEVKSRGRNRFYVESSIISDPRDGVRELNMLKDVYDALNKSLGAAEIGTVAARELPSV